MQTAYITHPLCIKHELTYEIPECPARITVIENQLIDDGLMESLQVHEAPAATNEQLLRAHAEDYINAIELSIPEHGVYQTNHWTGVNPFTYQAALRAAGAVVLGVDLVMAAKVKNAFCNIRPPGHYASHVSADRFCYFNNVSIGAMHALDYHGLRRVLIVDFEDAEGFGTERIFQNDQRVMLCSLSQHQFDCEANNSKEPIINMPNDNKINISLTAGNNFRAAISQHWIPAIERFQPELIFISATFPAHFDDEYMMLNFTAADYTWLTIELGKFAEGRIVSALEGGYELSSLGKDAVAHIKALQNGMQI